MSQRFDPRHLDAFFQEVKEQIGIELQYIPDNSKFPIQLTTAPNGIAKSKCIEILQFIKGQVDLQDNQIAKIYAAKTPGKFLIDISKAASTALADVYALSFFLPQEDEPALPPTKQKK